MGAKQGATRILGFLYETRWDDLPAQAQGMSVVCLRDLLAVAASALQTDASSIIRDHAVTHFGASPTSPSARMLFDGRSVSPSGAALAGAMAIDSLDAHDGYRPTKGHIGAWALPAVLAIADAGDTPVGGTMEGRDLLTCLAIAYELGSRLGVAQHATVPDYHASGSWGAVGSAAVASRMLGLDAVTAREAMGIAEYHSPRSQMMRCIDHPTMVKDSSGWGAMTGISSAYMAQSGFTGAPALIVEATECEVYWESLGQQWLVCEQYFKPYPVCRWAQAAIAAAQTLQATYDFTPEMIEHVEIFTFHEGCRLDHPRPTTTEQAQYSLPFPVAAILARGQCTAAEITTGLNDPNILNMANRIEMVEDTEYNRRFPAERLARAVIVLKDGRHLESPTTQAEGDPETPLSTDTFRAKYRDLVEPILGGKAADAVWDMAGSLAHGGTIEPFLETVLSPPGKMVGQVRKTN